MSQHDYVIDNQTFPATRTDINNALAAIVTTNAGATAPSTTYAYQLWYDTTNDILKMRNSDDDAWIDLFDINQTTDAASAKLGADVTISGDLTVDTDTLYVDSTNNRVGIGTTSPASSLSIFKATGTSQLQFGASNNYYWDVSRDNDVSGSLIISNKNAGAVTERMRILPSGGITFNGDTAAANALDDYEEGTWTATYGGSTTDPTTAVTTTGQYTKIGKLVFVSAAFNNVTTTGASGSIQIRGFPFTVQSDNFATGDVMFYLGTDIVSTYANVCVYAVAASTYCVFYATRQNASWVPINHSAGTSRYTWFTATYLTNA